MDRRRTGPAKASWGFLLFLALVAGCGKEPEPAEEGPVVARIGVPEADVSGADMGLGNFPAIFGREGLTIRGFDGRVRPRLAKSWEPSSDGLTWRLTLQDGVTFHDGTRLTAAIVVKTLRAATANPARLGLFPGLADVVRIDEASPSEVTITLKRRSTFLLEDLGFTHKRTHLEK